MLGFIVILVILIAGIASTIYGFGQKKDINGYSHDRNPGLGVAGVFAAVISGLILVSLIPSRIESYAKIDAFKAVRKTIAEEREDMDPSKEEGRFVEVKADWNAWLAQEKCHNKKFFEAWTADEVDNLKPLR